MTGYSFELLGGTPDNDWLMPAIPGIPALFSVFDGQAIYAGSAFMVDDHGQFVTAWHVIDRLRELQTETHGAANDCALFLGPSGGLAPITSMRPPADAEMTSDLAAGNVDLSYLRFRPPFFPLSYEPVVVGEDITAIGHAFMPDQVIKLNGGVFMVEDGVQIRAIRSIAVEVHEKWTNLPSPSFQMDDEMPGGMSGGPILRDATSEVAAVCSYGLTQNSGEHEPYCHGSMLGPLCELLV